MDQSFMNLLPRFIRNRLEGRHTLQKSIGNTGWLFTDRIIRMGVSLIVSIWVARYLGPEKFGLLNYAIAFVSLFGVLATLGLDGIVIRDIVRNPSGAQETLGSAFLLKFFGGITTILFAVGIAFIIHPQDKLTHWLVGIIAAGTIFQSLDTIDLWFQSQIQSKYSVYAKNTAFLTVSLIKIVLILSEAPLIAFACAGLAEIVLGSLGLIIMYKIKTPYLKSWSVNILRIKSLLRDSWALIFSGIVVMIYMKIDVVMLGQMAGQDAVGIYSAAVTLSESFYFIPVVIVGSTFPAIVALREIDKSLYRVRLQQMHDILSSLAFIIAVLITLFSYFIISKLFGERYIEAVIILNIHIWACLVVFPGNIRANLVVVENEQKIALVFRSFGALLNIALNYLLIPKYGGVGAAWATLASFIIPVGAIAFFNPFIRMTVYMTLKSYLLPLRYVFYRGALYKPSGIS